MAGSSDYLQDPRTGRMAGSTAGATKTPAAPTAAPVPFTAIAPAASAPHEAVDAVKPGKAPYRVSVWTVRKTRAGLGHTFRTSTQRHYFDAVEKRDAFAPAPPQSTTRSEVTAYGIDYEKLAGKVYRVERTARPSLPPLADA